MEKPLVNFIFFLKLLIIISSTALIAPPASAQEKLSGFDLQIHKWAEELRDEIINRFDRMISLKKITKTQLFDTFYIPIPNTYPQKYQTQYDKIFDKTLQGVLDRYQKNDNRILFAVVTDRNGYVPTHNSIFTQPLTGDREKDSLNNRTKRLFNDRTGLTAAQNTKSYLLQSYSRDTGEKVFDLSIPILFQGEHWGAVRIGYMR